MKHLLHADGLLTLYKAQVRSVMEYIPLTWMSGTRCHLNLLDKVQRQAERLIRGARQFQQLQQHQNQQQQHEQQIDAAEPLWDSLEHRRRLAVLTILLQVTGTAHVTPDGPKGHLEEI